MSRFPGWTAAAVNRILLKQEQNEPEIAKELKEKRKAARIRAKAEGNTGQVLDRRLISALNAKSGIHDKEDQICNALSILGIPFTREYKFSDKRNYRFDIAIPAAKIAIEYEGGIYTNGAHTRAKGYAKDTRKYNLAALEGWTVLRYTADNEKMKNWEFAIAEEVKQELTKRGIS